MFTNSNYKQFSQMNPVSTTERPACIDRQRQTGFGLAAPEESYFSSSYREARWRFRKMVRLLGMETHSYPVDGRGTNDLTIDVAVGGPDSAPAVVLSSGVHGVEGFLGSAVQLAFLNHLNRAPSTPRIRYVLIHGVNPYGFSRLRRSNEDNVDLNRNFLDEAGEFSGVPKDYIRLNQFLNPESLPSTLEPFTVKTAVKVLKAGRHVLRDSAEVDDRRNIRLSWQAGFQALKKAVANGQYEFPRGLFYGGREACQSTRIVQQNCEDWLGLSPRVLHLDFHTGLGRFGTCQLLLSKRSAETRYPWFAEAFGAANIQPFRSGGVADPASGLFGDWMEQRFADRNYRFVTPEFGTHPEFRVLKALRGENRAHHFCSPGSRQYQRIKKELLECFCPRSPSWRRRVMRSGLQVIEQGTAAMLEPGV